MRGIRSYTSSAASLVATAAALSLMLAFAGCRDSAAPERDSGIFRSYELLSLDPEPALPVLKATRCTVSGYDGQLLVAMRPNHAEPQFATAVMARGSCDGNDQLPVMTISDFGSWMEHDDSVTFESAYRYGSYVGQLTDVGGEEYLTVTMDGITYVWRPADLPLP